MDLKKNFQSKLAVNIFLKDFVNHIKAGHCIFFYGDLGVGKTIHLKGGFLHRSPAIYCTYKWQFYYLFYQVLGTTEKVVMPKWDQANMESIYVQNNFGNNFAYLRHSSASAFSVIWDLGPPTVSIKILQEHQNNSDNIII